jgi:glycosyltransferase involved in cell wall biosynthesis
MRFVLVSTHTDQTTGYSKVSFNLLKQLATLSPRVKTFHFGFQRHPNAPGVRKAPEGIVQYDAAANEDPKEEGFGFNKIREYLDMVNPDVVMIYNDPLIIHRFIDAMKHDKKTSSYRLWIYVDQVYQGIAQPLMDSIRDHADRIYAFTDTWKERLVSEYGITENVYVMEHAVDPTVFSRLPADARNAARRSMGISEDAVVFLNANRNSQRKRLDLTVAGFVRLLVNQPKAHLIIATNVSPQAGAYYDIPRMFLRELRRHSLPDVMATHLTLIDTSPPNAIDDTGINQIYNAADVGINTSDGEGFGLCQLEHMFVGAPQIVTDVGSYRSFLTEDVAAFIPAGDDVYSAGAMPLGGWAPSFSTKDVAQAMDSVIQNLPTMREAAKAYKFKSWAIVCDSWLEDVLSA